MKQTKFIMGMPITVEVKDVLDEKLLGQVFAYFVRVDEIFSPFKEGSEVGRINAGKLMPRDYSAEMNEVLRLAEQTREETKGYFNIRTPDGKLDPSGLVKGWAIKNAAEILRAGGSMDYFIDAGGDIEASKPSDAERGWRIGIQNPFNNQEIIKAVELKNGGVATSGTYNRGAHIYNPHQPTVTSDVVSLTVIGPNVYEADRFATAAFAMGMEGVYFLERLPGFEAYLVDKNGIGTATSGFNTFLVI